MAKLIFNYSAMNSGKTMDLGSLSSSVGGIKN